MKLGVVISMVLLGLTFQSSEASSLNDTRFKVSLLLKARYFASIFSYFYRFFHCVHQSFLNRNTSDCASGLLNGPTGLGLL